MKIHVNFLSALIIVTLFVLSSCEMDNLHPEDTESIVFTASVEQPMEPIGTKSSLEEGNVVKWSNGDRIKIYSKSTGNYDTGSNYETSSTGTSGTFSKIAGQPDLTGNKYMAYYPLSGVSSINNTTGNLTVVLPSIQNYSEGSYGTETNPVVAYTESGTQLNFKNICGIIKIHLYGEATIIVKKIHISSAQKLSGEGTVTVNTEAGENLGIPTLSMSSGASNEVTLDCGDGVAIGTSAETATPFYIVVPVSSGETYGFTVQVETSDSGTMTKTAAARAANRVQRSAITSMPAIAYTAEAALHYIDNGIDYGAGFTIDGQIWAPVNCGYDANHTYGLLYQWGRKDGQGYVLGTSKPFKEYSGDPEQSYIITTATSGHPLTNPNANIFYAYASGSHRDWYTIDGVQDNLLWNSGTEVAPVKVTANDPCPEGWRVPTYNELNALKTNHSGWTSYNSQYGYWFSGSVAYASATNKIFISAAGARGSDGNAYDRGGYGHYWSSARNGYPYQASDLYFNNSSPSMSNDDRAAGYSVRCVKE